MISVTTTTLLLTLAAEPGASALRAEATRDFNAKRYAEACEKYERAANLNSQDGAIWADLGLCLEKLGKTPEAIEASKRAAALNDKKARQNAYYNLGKMGEQVKLPATTQCTSLRSGTCALNACAYDWTVRTPEMGSAAKAVRIAVREKTARAGLTESNIDKMPLTASEIRDAKDGASRGPSLDLALSRRDWESCACDTRETPEEEAQCKRECKPKEESTDCALVHVDACRRLVGVYCKEKNSGKAVSAEFEISSK